MTSIYCQQLINLYEHIKCPTDEKLKRNTAEAEFNYSIPMTL